MKKIKLMLFITVAIFPFFANATTVSVFSTSSDWEAITGLRLSEHRVKFNNDNSDLVKSGLELYFLDGFPCFAQTGKTRIWIGQNNKTDDEIRLTCLYTPDYVKFAWRNAKQDDSQGKTVGILNCSTVGQTDITIDLSKCTMDTNWTEYK